MKTSDIITLHPGKQHNLEQAEQLINYFPSVKHITSLSISKDTVKKLSFLPKKIINEISKRSVPHQVAQHTDTFPWYELFYKLNRISNKNLPYSFFKKRNEAFQKKILKRYAAPKVFIGFDTSSEFIFKQWKGKTKLILDLTIAIPQYKKRLAEQYNLSAATINNLTNGDEIWYQSYKNELELADFILCGSEFVKQSCLYLNVPEEKLKVISYGANLEKFTPSVLPENKKDSPFKLAFVGNVSFRKGADVLLRAWDKIRKRYPETELHFFGNLQIELTGYNLENVFFHGFITQEQLIENLNKCHVSILPTFFEGSSYAIYQSMAMGLGVITTPNCGSVIQHMHNGILIEYGSEEQIINAVTLLIEDRKTRLELSNRAMHDIKQYSWDSYGNKLRSFISNL